MTSAQERQRRRFAFDIGSGCGVWRIGLPSADYDTLFDGL